ncbi:MAG: HK97 family phage prohead protease [Paracoccus sp. (in: a-proteobacteria)]|uniref:HK97 family phage prohead protease n=1 Tax=Paracoccus sp. TaxID=267 RepID=UPI0026DF219C|nr:HK97 family phage prohead protease [Paracoccus sp. (in: a-proteobacteria)]MDO5613629.1 HK97 family phage prohead protease [Paracoccus sp. (in: a-proteobacteria)]
MMAGPVFNAGLELRAAGDGSRRLTGRFPYNKRAVIHSGGKGQRPQKEQFAPRAFGFAVDDPDRDIHLLVGHSFDHPLASKKAGSLILNDGDEALTFQAILTPEIQRASWVQDFLAAFAAGLITGISPGFRVAPIDGAESTEEEEPSLGKALIRTIAAAVLFELSMVTRPAYGETEASLRHFQPAPARGLIHPLNRWRL